MTCLVTLFDRKLQLLKNSPSKIDYFLHLNELLSSQNVNFIWNETFTWKKKYFCVDNTVCSFSVLPFMRQAFFGFAHPYVGQWSMKIKAPWLSSYLGITMLIDSFFFCSTSIFSWPWNQFEFQYLCFTEEPRRAGGKIPWA